MIVGAAAVLALLLISGGALTGALMLSRHARLEREQRIALVAPSKLPPADALGSWLKGRSSRLDVHMQRFFAAGADTIWGMELGALSSIVIALASAAAVWALTRIVFGLPLWVALPAAVAFGYVVPRLLLQRQQRKAVRAFSDLFPDAVDAIGRMLRAGLPVSSAVRSVGAEAPPPVNTVFTMVSDQMGIGTPIEEALDVSSRYIALPDFRFFTVAVVLQHMTGGNLAATLEILSEIVRKRRAVRLKSRATTAEIRVSAYVLGGLPFFILGALLLVQPGYLTPLFVDPRGHVILAVAGGLLFMGAITMRQMMKSVTNL
jgi:tight adherence protein B